MVTSTVATVHILGVYSAGAIAAARNAPRAVASDLPPARLWAPSFRVRQRVAMAPAEYLARGITADSRSKSYSRRGLHRLKKKNGGKFPEHPKKEKPAEPEFTGRWYPGEDVKKPKKRRIIRNPPRLRSSITPGTVLILLAGRFKGKRVVFLKQLPSGLLLVSGPFKINGVPARRVNQAYVIATSTKIELPSLDLDTFDDAFFKSAEKKAKRKSEDEDMMAEDDEEPKPKVLAQEYLDAQKKIDSELMKAISSEYKGYLGTRFGLKSGDRPHLMKF